MENGASSGSRCWDGSMVEARGRCISERSYVMGGGDWAGAYSVEYPSCCIAGSRL